MLNFRSMSCMEFAAAALVDISNIQGFGWISVDGEAMHPAIISGRESVVLS